MPSESYPDKVSRTRKRTSYWIRQKLTGWIFRVYEIPSFSRQSLECHRAYLSPIPSEHPSCMLLPNTLWRPNTLSVREIHGGSCCRQFCWTLENLKPLHEVIQPLRYG